MSIQNTKPEQSNPFHYWKDEQNKNIYDYQFNLNSGNLPSQTPAVYVINCICSDDDGYMNISSYITNIKLEQTLITSYPKIDITFEQSQHYILNYINTMKKFKLQIQIISDGTPVAQVKPISMILIPIQIVYPMSTDKMMQTVYDTNQENGTFIMSFIPEQVLYQITYGVSIIKKYNPSVEYNSYDVVLELYNQISKNNIIFKQNNNQEERVLLNSDKNTIYSYNGQSRTFKQLFVSQRPFSDAVKYINEYYPIFYGPMCSYFDYNGVYNLFDIYSKRNQLPCLKLVLLAIDTSFVNSTSDENKNIKDGKATLRNDIQVGALQSSISKINSGDIQKIYCTDKIVIQNLSNKIVNDYGNIIQFVSYPNNKLYSQVTHNIKQVSDYENQDIQPDKLINYQSNNSFDTIKKNYIIKGPNADVSQIQDILYETQRQINFQVSTELVCNLDSLLTRLGYPIKITTNIANYNNVLNNSVHAYLTGVSMNFVESGNNMYKSNITIYAQASKLGEPMNNGK